MRVDVIGTAAEVTDQRVEGHSVAVIDVFRATSVMVTALENGATSIIPITGVDETFALRDKMLKHNPQANIIIGGERKTEIVEGFDLDNSPLRYTPEVIAGATIIMSTTNGTRAVNCARAAAEIYIAALLNADAAADALAESGRDVVLICSGRHNRFTIEDGLCAGMMARRLEQVYGYRPTDFAWAMIDIYERWAEDLRGALDHCEHYNNIKNRWAEDISWCLERNRINTTPKVTKDGGIKLWKTPQK